MDNLSVSVCRPPSNRLSVSGVQENSARPVFRGGEPITSGQLQATLQLETNMRFVEVGDHWLEFALARPFQPLDHFASIEYA
jgi:hypothetical protein